MHAARGQISQSIFGYQENKVPIMSATNDTKIRKIGENIKQNIDGLCTLVIILFYSNYSNDSLL